MKKYKVIVTGVVQGVGYRYFCKMKAIEYNIKGYAKNLVNGNVELEIEGEPGLISDYLKELRIGPAGAFVKSITETELPYDNKHFEFRIL